MFFLCSGTKKEHAMSALPAFASPALRNPLRRGADAASARAGIPRHAARQARLDPVIETPLASLAHQSERRFTAWRGRSGKRYVASAFPLTDEAALGFPDAVLIAVSGDRRIVALREAGGFGEELGLARWRDWAALAGAEEIHVHLLADSEEARRSAMVDLTPMKG
jgi:hypothetical protein